VICNEQEWGLFEKEKFGDSVLIERLIVISMTADLEL
jgi:hypothetical protein